jgi:hypothetical protein
MSCCLEGLRIIQCHFQSGVLGFGGQREVVADTESSVMYNIKHIISYRSNEGIVVFKRM